MNVPAWWMVGLAILGLLGVAQIVWPRWFAWFQQLGLYRDTPEPTAFLIWSIRVSGLVIVLGSCVVIAMISGIEDRVDSAREAEVAEAVDVAEIEQEMQRISNVMGVCESSIAVLAPAIVLETDGTILNLSELESLAETEDVVLRPWAEQPTKKLIVSHGGTSMYALPTSGEGKPCAELSQRLLLNR